MRETAPTSIVMSVAQALSVSFSSVFLRALCASVLRFR